MSNYHLKKLLYPGLFLLIVSCSTLGYDPHNKPVPPQPGKTFTICYGEKKGTSIPLHSIEKPVNHESGWDRDDIILVFKSPLIDLDSALSWNWNSNSQWTKSRLKMDPPFGYGGKLGARIKDGEIRISCGSRGQFLVDLDTVCLTFNRYQNKILKKL